MPGMHVEGRTPSLLGHAEAGTPGVTAPLLRLDQAPAHSITPFLPRPTDQAVQEGPEAGGCHPQDLPRAWRDAGHEGAAAEQCGEQGSSHGAGQARRPAQPAQPVLLARVRVRARAGLFGFC